MGRQAKGKLNAAGITTVKQLSDTDSAVLQGLKVNEKFKLHAKAHTDNKEIVIKKPELPKTKTEIFFDVESETQLNIDYLYGLLIREGKKEKYTAYWADSIEEEKKIWKDFCSFMSKQDDFTVYYYTSYELQSLKRLKVKYGMDEKLYKKILDNAIDLYSVLTKNIILPVYSYSIKSVARYLGFDWESEKASGSQSMVWYTEYIKAKNKKIKDTIIQYNKDDCVATRVLKDWLVKL